MRDDNRVKKIAERLRDSDPITAAADAQRLLDTWNYKDHIDLPLPRIPSWQERMDAIYHELGHVIGRLIGGAADIFVRIRDDASGECVSGPIEKLEDRITSRLAGVVAEARFNPLSIHGNRGAHDYLVARQLIDELNARGTWPPLSYEGAARKSIHMIEENWQAVERLALVLANAGEICDADIRLFATCGQ
jgi:hypothetical protein